MSDGSLSTLLCEAPVGASLLAHLEAGRWTQRRWEPSEVEVAHRGRVADAVAAVTSMSFGELLVVALRAAFAVGPWTAGAEELVTAAYRCAEDRAPIAEAIADRFGPSLAAPVDRARQERWFREPPGEGDEARRQAEDLTDVYENGEFTWASVRTVTTPPAEAEEEIAWARELSLPVVRVPLAVDPAARVHEIHAPSDWIALVEGYPAVATRAHSTWELPGPNAGRGTGLADRELATGGRAARSSIERHVLPDWQGVAGDLDGVHLSWAGFLTCEGHVVDLPSGGVTMLRYWGSEQTLWVGQVLRAV